MEWIKVLFLELWRWRKLYRWISKDENEIKIKGYDFDIDWIGRIHKIINFPENNPPLDVVHHRIHKEVSERYDRMRSTLGIFEWTIWDYKQVGLSQYLFIITPNLGLIFKNLGSLSLVLFIVSTIAGIILGSFLLTWFSIILAPLLVFLLAFSYVLVL